MHPNLKWKAVFIVVVILGCIYGLFGVPTFPTSTADLKSNFAHQIKLGLDLQGGTHLILQVQVQEAIAQETDQTVDRLTNQLRAKNIRYDEVRRIDDTHIVVRNVPSEQLSEFLDLVASQLQNAWDMTPTAGGASTDTPALRQQARAAILQQTKHHAPGNTAPRRTALGPAPPHD